jgi:hypothetical protein
MAEELLTGTIAAPGFSGLNTQDSSIQLDSGFALEAYNCVIDKYGRIGSRKGWMPVNTTALSPAGSVRSIFELVKSDGNVVFSAANNKIYTGTTTLTNLTVYNTHFHTGTYSQTATTITCSITSHGFIVGTSLYLTFGTGTAVSGVYTVATVINGNSFTVTSATSATTSGSISGCIDILTSYAITDDNWQIAAMPYDHSGNTSAHAIFAQAGHPLLVYHKIGTASHTHIDGYGLQRLGDIATLPAGYLTTSFTPNCALTAFGRLWVANIQGDTQTIYFSDLQNPAEWTTGTAGSLDISTVIPTGDPIVALAQHNGFLVIFCRRHVVIYSGASDPATMTLQDVVSGVGCIARDSVVSVAGTDLLFLSATGVQSFQRIIQEKSLPFRDVSKNVRDNLIQLVKEEDSEADIKAVYYPTDAFYLLSLPSSGFTYCFDTRGVLENGASRATIWKQINPTAFYVTEDRDLYIGKEGYIGKYEGYEDNQQTYRMTYFTNYFDFGSATSNKILKSISITAIGGSFQPIAVKWGYDYTNNYASRVIQLNGVTISEYNIAEYGIAEYSNGIALDRIKIPASGSGTILQLGFESEINGTSLSIQKIDFFLKQGKTL